MQDLPPDPDFVPDSPFLLGQERLLSAAFNGVDLAPLGNRLIAHLQQNPDDAIRYLDLSFVLQTGGNEKMAAVVQGEALQLCRHFRLPTLAREPAVRLLAIMAPGTFMANTPLEFLVSKADIALETLYVLPGEDMPMDLPEHDVLFIAVGESAQTRELLYQLCDAVEGWTAPLLNHPAHSLSLGRDAVSIICNESVSIHMPLTARIKNQELALVVRGEPERDFLADATWPLIARPLDSHAGYGLERMDDREMLADYLARYATVPEFYVSSFVDYRSADGLFRKYRIVFIEGKPFLCHMAISSKWMVHYLNADMTEKAERRAEEAQAMEDFDDGFAVRHKDAFAELHESFPLDYFGIDCGETIDGKLLIFEVDTGMIVHAMDPKDMFPYKHVAMRKVFDAFQEMVRKAAGRASV